MPLKGAVAMFTRFAEWLCFARIPGWTARVGQPWDTYDVTPWNLYNILWRGQQTLARRVYRNVA